MENKRNLILIIATVVIAALLIILSYWAGTNEKKEEAQPTKASPEESVKATASVDITAKGFSPATITIKKGTLVTFTNKDKKEHQVASDPHPNHTKLAGFDSVTNLKTSNTYSFLFEKAGTYTYHDELNPLKFKGTVIVK